MPHIFISYSHIDKSYSQKLAESLKSRELNYWIDNNILPGDKWAEGVLEALNSCTAFIIIMTPEAQASKWVNKEILIADDRRIPIFPILLRGDRFPILVDYQYESVLNEELPSERFYERISEVVNVSLSDNKESSNPESQEFEKAIVLSDAHYKADLRLLGELWYFINSSRVSYIMESVYNRNLEYDYYFKYLDKYFYVRQRPEKHFIDKDLEDAFQTFDKVLAEFDVQFTNDSTPIKWGDREIFKPSYKLHEIDSRRFEPVSEEVYRQQCARHDETIENTRRVRKSLAELIKFIQLKFPEFDFPDVPTWEEPSNL